MEVFDFNEPVSVFVNVTNLYRKTHASHVTYTKDFMSKGVLAYTYQGLRDSLKHFPSGERKREERDR